MQLHYGAQRDTNYKIFKRLGVDTGFNCILVEESGEYTTDEKSLEQIVKDICFNNAARYFDLNSI